MALTSIVKKIFGSRNERVLRQHERVVEQINQLEPSFQALTDEALKAKTQELRARLQNDSTLSDILPEAFATVREAARRTLKMRHFDVQLIGGMVLNDGNIAEMLTGEGKTLVATLPSYLNALTGKGVHLVTVNDYLAKRDAEWMKPIYDLLGMTVGVNIPGMTKEEKQQAYAADIVYGTNNEFGFDYLRDNMVFRPEERVQRGLNFAIVDEVDSILIDEARTPLIISGPSEEGAELYKKIDKVIPELVKQEKENGPGDYSVDEKTKQAFLTEAGHERVEEILVNQGLLTAGESLYDAQNVILMHHIVAALRAHALYQRDVAYVVKDNEVVIVDEHTGRLMIGRRWSDGLHQAVEAKENVSVQNENQTLASITFQNYFRMYNKLSGMTGTADTEAYEFHQIYGLEVIVIPPNRVVARKDFSDKVYVNLQQKFKAVVAEIKDCVGRGQPVLVGTTSIEISEFLSKTLKKENISHEVLNAKQHEKEAHIIAQAGKPGSITIATNMAGRGTDIVLGGNLEAEIEALENPTELDIQRVTAEWEKRHAAVIAAGGLHVLGTERHESRRIDNQLRGRSGRQGDPGSSRFYLSMEDNLLRIFASDKLAAFMQRVGVEDEALEHPMLSRVIENAQRKVEGHNFDMRKQLLEYDDVANEQRRVIYDQRDQLMQAEDISETIQAMIETVMTELSNKYIPPESFPDEWNISDLEQELQNAFDAPLPVRAWLEADDQLDEERLREKIQAEVLEKYRRKEESVGAEMMRQVEKSILLQNLDYNWKEHLAAMDHLRLGIHLRGYAQKNPKQEYKKEAFEMFAQMLKNLRYSIVSTLCKVQFRDSAQIDALEEQRRLALAAEMQFLHGSEDTQTGEVLNTDASEIQRDEQSAKPFMRDTPKVGRNDPCPCGSGKKYKHCHGQVQ